MAEKTRTPTILRDAEVERMVGIPRSTRYDMTRRGDFPAPVWITPKTRGYMSDEIEAWIEGRRQKRSIPQSKPWTPCIDHEEEARP